jgi:hypothetical protein
MNDLPSLEQPCAEPDRNKSRENHGRESNGRWKKGFSPNPAGQPSGSRHHKTLLLEGLLGERGPEVLAKIIELGLKGNEVCLRIMAERLYPPRKSMPLRLQLPPLATISDAQVAMAAIVEGTSNGAIRPDEAVALSGVVGQFVKTVETAELDDRIAKLEAAVEAARAGTQPYNA